MKDPVCGMTVKEPPALWAEWKGARYGFCNPRCKEKFLVDPVKYLQPDIAPPPALPAASYICPMHPEVVQEGPGDCPKCGMALEPVLLSAGDAPDSELRNMTRRFWVSLLLTLPVFLLAMTEMFIPGLKAASWVPWAQLLPATPVVLWGGWPFFARGWTSILKRSPNMFTLIALGTGAAYGDSVAATFFPGIFPAAFRDQSGRVGRLF